MAILTIAEICKKRKRKPKFYGFHTFADPGCPVHLTGPFRDNIRFFLQECGEIEDYNVDGSPIWCTHLVNENNGAVVPLYTVEESVNQSLRPFCDHCRCTGWSHHFVSKRRYHLIIPIVEEWYKVPDGSFFDLHTHLLHGLIHCNGFGHLLSINGLEGGSKLLCGREIMDLWDRICTSLKARKITVEDVSTKRSMNLRLLYGVAYGHPWFGRWGYKFCHGSFGVTEHKYFTAIEILSTIDLDKLIEHFYDMGLEEDLKQIKQIIRIYREMSETQLITIRDLLRFMLMQKSSAPMKKFPTLLPPPSPPPPPPPPVTKPVKKQNRPKSPLKGESKSSKYRRLESFAVENSSRWPARRLEYAAEVIVNALKDHHSGGMARQEVRDAARLHIGDTGLLDFVLKSINNLIVGDCVVQRAVNPSTRILEFTIQEINGKGNIKKKKNSNTASDCETSMIGLPAINTRSPITRSASASTAITSPPGLDVYNDLVYLYKRVFEGGYSGSEIIELATRAVLDSKHFMKDWPFRDENDTLLRFICRMLPSCIELDTDMFRPHTVMPGELVVLPTHATVGELKREIECAFKDTYCVMEGFLVREVEGLEDMEDGEVLFGAVESGANLTVVGDIIGGMVMKRVAVAGEDDDGEEDDDEEEMELRYEGGGDKWTVDCSCGAKDDDGERMVACDICEVWQHTRCSGIDDSEAVPLLFLCERCGSSLMPERFDDESYCIMEEA